MAHFFVLEHMKLIQSHEEVQPQTWLSLLVLPMMFGLWRSDLIQVLEKGVLAAYLYDSQITL